MPTDAKTLVQVTCLREWQDSANSGIAQRVHDEGAARALTAVNFTMSKNPPVTGGSIASRLADA
jgi:hypothetical protein